MERHSCILVLAGTPIFGVQVSATRCARAVLAAQAHGTPLVHKVVLVGTVEMVSVLKGGREGEGEGGGGGEAHFSQWTNSLVVDFVIGEGERQKRAIDSKSGNDVFCSDARDSIVGQIENEKALIGW